MKEKTEGGRFLEGQVEPDKAEFSKMQESCVALKERSCKNRLEIMSEGKREFLTGR